MSGDYSQIELRLLAHLSQDPTMIDGFKHEQDIHRRTASEVFGIPFDEVTPEQRSHAKAVNFGIIYGISDFGLSRNISISRKQAKEYIESYFDRYTPIQGSAADIIKMAMNAVQDELETRHLKTRLLVQVHDELVLEVPASEKDEVEGILRDKMEHVVTLSVPLTVDIHCGTNWEEAK